MKVTMLGWVEPFATRARPVFDGWSWSADGRWFVCVSEDGDAVVVDVASSAERSRIPGAGPGERYFWVTMAPSGDSFLIGPSWGGNAVRRWSLDGARLADPVVSVDNPHSARLVTDTLLVEARLNLGGGNQGGPCELWRHDLGSGRDPIRLSRHEGELRTWHVDVEADVVLTGDRSGQVEAWSLRDGTRRWQVRPGTSDVCNVKRLGDQVMAVLRNGPLVSLSLADGATQVIGDSRIRNNARLAALGARLAVVNGGRLSIAGPSLLLEEAIPMPGTVSDLAHIPGAKLLLAVVDSSLRSYQVEL